MDLYSFFSFFWIRQLTDRAILANRQTQEKNLNKAETYYVLWRRFLHLNERLRTLDAQLAARTINRNKGRILEHLVQVLSEWIIASIEPAKELTRTKKPEFLFLRTKDFWFRPIWIIICTKRLLLIVSPVETERRLVWFVASVRMTMSNANMLMSSSS